MVDGVLYPNYAHWLADHTRTWRVDWSGNVEAVRAWLEPAVIHPTECRKWRHHATWELVREAVRRHDDLSRHLQAWDWPACQRWWSEIQGPFWDPYGWALATRHRPSDRWMFDFAKMLHHPIQPGLAAWAYGAWKVNPSGVPRDLSGLSPMQALDGVLRRISPGDLGMEGAWKQAWQDWIDTEPPHSSDPVPTGHYPTDLVASWRETLAKIDQDDMTAPIKSSQIQWF